MLSGSNERLRFEDDADDRSILTVNTLSKPQLIGLLETNDARASSVDNVECFAVRSDNPIQVNSLPASVNGKNVSNNFAAGANSLFVRYNLRNDTVVVE